MSPDNETPSVFKVSVGAYSFLVIQLQRSSRFTLGFALKYGISLHKGTSVCTKIRLRLLKSPDVIIGFGSFRSVDITFSNSFRWDFMNWYASCISDDDCVNKKPRTAFVLGDAPGLGKLLPRLLMPGYSLLNFDDKLDAFSKLRRVVVVL